jgi:diadenosine tetraphosphate (Ap4A) HIT family hydrolase
MICELCETIGGELLWQNARCRIVLVNDADYPGFCRVIWQNHVREMTDLSSADRTHFMSVVFIVEETLREIMRPDKINLASLGNMTPHLHWHVIPRFNDDKHFPNPIWGAVTRSDGVGRDRAVIISELASLLARKLERVTE